MKKRIDLKFLEEDLAKMSLVSGSKTAILNNFFKDWIKSSLMNGKIKVGELMPSKSDLANLLNVSLGTIQNVYRYLEANNLVESKQCVGTVIKGLKRGGNIRKLTSKRDIAIDVIHRYILKNGLKKGDKLPSCRFLSNKTGLAINTMRNGLEELTVQGLLKKSGKSLVINTAFKVLNEKSNKYATLVEKITAELKEYIRTNLKEGAKLPSHKDLAKELKVSEKTIHEAMKPLITDGTLIPRRGQYGTVVANIKADNEIVIPKEMSIFASATDTMFYHYEKTQTIIKRMITERYEIGEKLPSIIEMAQLLDLSPNTIRKSFDILAQEGYVRFERGRYGGTFVTEIPDSSETQVYKWIAVNPNY